jgi:hypothetical protein
MIKGDQTHQEFASIGLLFFRSLHLFIQEMCCFFVGSFPKISEVNYFIEVNVDHTRVTKTETGRWTYISWSSS